MISPDIVRANLLQQGIPEGKANEIITQLLAQQAMAQQQQQPAQAAPPPPPTSPQQQQTQQPPAAAAPTTVFPVPGTPFPVTAPNGQSLTLQVLPPNFEQMLMDKLGNQIRERGVVAATAEQLKQIGIEVEGSALVYSATPEQAAAHPLRIVDTPRAQNIYLKREVKGTSTGWVIFIGVMCAVVAVGATLLILRWTGHLGGPAAMVKGR